MNIAIIPAGGQGRRMGGLQSNPRPKQFLALGGIPLIVYTLRQFELCPDIDRIIVVLPESEITAGSLQTLVDEYELKKVLDGVAGADERQGSVYCGLKALSNNPSLSSKVEIVAIHDAVRPFITSALISE